MTTTGARNERGFEATHERIEPRQVVRVERVGGTEREANAVEAHRINRAKALEP